MGTVGGQCGLIKIHYGLNVFKNGAATLGGPMMAEWAVKMSQTLYPTAQTLHLQMQQQIMDVVTHNHQSAYDLSDQVLKAVQHEINHKSGLLPSQLSDLQGIVDRMWDYFQNIMEIFRWERLAIEPETSETEANDKVLAELKALDHFRTRKIELLYETITQKIAQLSSPPSPANLPAPLVHPLVAGSSARPVRTMPDLFPARKRRYTDIWSELE